MSKLDSPLSAPPSPASTEPGVRSGDVPTALVLIPLAVVLLVGVAIVYSPADAEQLLLGWLYFPWRVLPQVTVDWPSVLLGAFCLVAFVAGLHWTRCWLERQRHLATSAVAPRVRFSTSCACAAIVLLAFAAGTATVGATHQLVWIATGKGEAAARRGLAAMPVNGLLSQAQARSDRKQQKNNLKMVGLGVHNFHDTFSCLPLGGAVDDRGRLLHGWASSLGPYIDFSVHQLDFGVPWNEPPNDRLYRCALPIFLNPAVLEVFDDQGYGLSHIAGNVHVLPIVEIPRRKAADFRFKLMEEWNVKASEDRRHQWRLSEIADGQANTLLIGEAAGNYRPWGYPVNVRDPALGMGESLDGFGGAPGTEGGQFVMCDGSVRFINNRIDRAVLRAMGSPAGGEAPPEPGD